MLLSDYIKRWGSRYI